MSVTRQVSLMNIIAEWATSVVDATPYGVAGNAYPSRSLARRQLECVVAQIVAKQPEIYLEI